MAFLLSCPTTSPERYMPPRIASASGFPAAAAFLKSSTAMRSL